MRKRLIIGSLLTLALVLTFVVLAVFPAMANSTPSNSTSKSGTVGEIDLQLPPSGGSLTHPTAFKMLALDFDRRSGSEDGLRIDMWVSALNTYVPVAYIRDQPWTAQDKAGWNNSAIYLEVNGVVIRNNLKEVADKELDVWTETMWTQYGSGGWGWDEYGRYIWNTAGDKTLNANLTVPVSLDFTGLPPTFGASFTAPAMSMKFIAIAEGFSYGPSTTIMPSGTKTTITGTQVPAWAYAKIPAWGTGQKTVAANIFEDFVITFTRP